MDSLPDLSEVGNLDPSSSVVVIGQLTVVGD